MALLRWWLKIAFIGSCSLFFLCFGFSQLISAYDMGHPQMFVVVFFSASLVIMVSFVGILYPIFQIAALMKQRKKASSDRSS
ncbi:MAG: hypothetical protein N2509_08490 [Treponemataceae bacterium]|nr:hypothetical protein [Treponemataceae bacterium]